MLEAVYEGYLMHYGEPRAFTGMDDDLRLLAGDALYALGLARLAESGDLEAVAVLSDLISAIRSGTGGGPPRGRRGALGVEFGRPRWAVAARPATIGSGVRPVRNPLVRSVTKLALPIAGRKNP